MGNTRDAGDGELTWFWVGVPVVQCLQAWNSNIGRTTGSIGGWESTLQIIGRTLRVIGKTMKVIQRETKRLGQ